MCLLVWEMKKTKTDYNCVVSLCFPMIFVCGTRVRGKDTKWSKKWNVDQKYATKRDNNGCFTFLVVFLCEWGPRHAKPGQNNDSNTQKVLKIAKERKMTSKKSEENDG